MNELVKMKQLLINYLNDQEELNNEYNLGNDQYLNGLWDSIRLIDKQITKELKEMEKYYNEDTETENNETIG